MKGMLGMRKVTAHRLAYLLTSRSQLRRALQASNPRARRTNGIRNQTDCLKPAAMPREIGPAHRRIRFWAGSMKRSHCRRARTRNGRKRTSTTPPKMKPMKSGKAAKIETTGRKRNGRLYHMATSARHQKSAFTDKAA